MLRKVDILGVPVSALDMSSAVTEITRRVDARGGGYVCAADMNSIMQAQRNPAHLEALRSADLVVADGTPLVWTARARGAGQFSRVPGPDLMLEICGVGVKYGWRHYFYGGAEGVAQDLAAAMKRLHPGLGVAGLGSPPFRPLSPEERRADVASITKADPHIVWVGLGCPKQEAWMKENRLMLDRALLIGVGAAFDFHSSRVQRAPQLMRRYGLEWLHRLGSEPKRLWRRYLLLGPEFLFRAAIESIRHRTSARSAERLTDEST